jgi:glycosyltransferase involved in cell wall biosynthesis
MRLIIVGSDNGNVFGRKFQDMIQPGENVIFLGYASDAELTRLYTHAKLLIFASLYEGFGIPPLEAMACGCPCLVSNTSSLPEVCGDAALYCDPYDVGDIAAKMKSLLDDNDLRSQLVARGKERVREFSWDESARALLDTIKSVQSDLS